ncbi:bifunctional SulP family inorganic anion transporter/carbonic anhydrase [Methyloterricola oryzae]|uniref:bifunctional SulP family inorganic anion transporter/carbonic anhydrase n=1 Tax=Methyloterricola oryzae TaxID=1495050 RepID=UPI0005EB77B3|nr:carbonic anhydrase family protein [Methyloterricola oryzae]
MRPRARLTDHIKQDIPAGLVVFLIALPMCLGIALASGAPLYSGIIAGIIGGLVVGSLSRSPHSVTGPATGLTAFTMFAIQELGSYEAFLLSVVFAGLLQILLGLARAGLIADYFPSNVVQGMLTGIGLIIILKQLPHALGWDMDAEGDFAFFQNDGKNTFTELGSLLSNLHPGAAAVSLLAVAGMIAVDVRRKLGWIPGSLAAILAGLLFNEILLALHSPWALNGSHLVNLPVTRGLADFAQAVDFPDFSRWNDPKVLEFGLMIGLLASVETLLCLEALSKLDPERRYVPPNEELVAQGVGNALSGMIGGLPMTSVVVRSSANLEAGARSQLSTICHGALLLLAVLAMPALLNHIPLAAVAAVMLMVGYKLVRPEALRAIFAQGRDQYIPFLVTVGAVLLTDILRGVAIGLAVSILFILQRNFRDPLSFFRNRHIKDRIIKIELSTEVSFLSRANVLVSLASVPPDSRLIIDASKSAYIDADVLEIIRDFIQIKAPAKSIQLTLLGFKSEYAIENTPSIYDVVMAEEPAQTGQLIDAPNLHKRLQSRLNPHLALQLLKEGNFRFVNNLKAQRDVVNLIGITKDGQHPFATVLSCIDSRTSSELIFDLGLGDIFSIRIAGNILNEDILGSMEFACKVAGSKIIVVLGHSKCGAIKGACDHVQMGHLSGLVAKVQPAIRKVTHIPPPHNSKNPDFVHSVAINNVKWVMRDIYQSSEILRELVDQGKLGIVGGMYDVETGIVEFYEDAWYMPKAQNEELPLAAMAMN